jgi:hypothetical protein
MKKLLILFTLFFGFMFKSQSADLSTIVDSTKQVLTDMKGSVKATINEIDTSSTFKEMYSDLKHGIIALASSLKVSAEHVYYVLVRQQFVKGVECLFILIIGFLLILNWLKKYKDDNEKWVKYSGGDAGPSGLGLFRILHIIVAGVFFFIGIFNIDLIFTGIINPEYGAIQDVIKMVQDLRK